MNVPAVCTSAEVVGTRCLPAAQTSKSKKTAAPQRRQAHGFGNAARSRRQTPSPRNHLPRWSVWLHEGRPPLARRARPVSARRQERWCPDRRSLVIFVAHPADRGDSIFGPLAGYPMRSQPLDMGFGDPVPRGRHRLDLDDPIAVTGDHHALAFQDAVSTKQSPAALPGDCFASLAMTATGTAHHAVAPRPHRVALGASPAAPE